MDKPSLILSKLTERFPGLADGTESVNGGDVVEFLSQFQQELTAIAERGAQTGRRRAQPKHTYFTIGTASYIDKHVVTDPHVAANKFLKKRKCVPDHIKSEGDTENFIKVLGVCELSGRVILEGDDYVYIQKTLQDDDGDMVVSLEKTLREVLDPDAIDVVVVERNVVEAVVNLIPGESDDSLGHIGAMQRKIEEAFPPEIAHEVWQDYVLSHNDVERASSLWNNNPPSDREAWWGLKVDFLRRPDPNAFFENLDVATGNALIEVMKQEGWM